MVENQIIPYMIAAVVYDVIWNQSLFSGQLTDEGEHLMDRPDQEGYQLLGC